MLELEEARSRILAMIPDPVVERVDVREAWHRVLAQQAIASLDLPGFDNSAMDGYAVRAGDLAAATRQNPVRLRLAGQVAAGEMHDRELAPGTAVRLFTGSPLPRGADAVAMQEDTRMEPEYPGEILVVEAVKPWENVRFRGEDVKQGAPLMEAGGLLTASRIALLAAAGHSHVGVGRRPVVGLMATGSELVEPGAPLAPGKIYECNRAALAPLIRSAGGVPVLYPLVPDEMDATRAALERAVAECDMVVTCGGVSVGERDLVKAAFERIGGSLQFWKVAVKPGRPFVLGRFKNKLLLGLPGNPVSAWVTFLALVRPALLRWQGAAEVSPPSSPGILAEPLANPGTRRHFMRVTVDRSGRVRSAGLQESHILSSASSANGLLEVPAETVLPAGAAVQVLHWE